MEVALANQALETCKRDVERIDGELRDYKSRAPVGGEAEYIGYINCPPLPPPLTGIGGRESRNCTSSAAR